HLVNKSDITVTFTIERSLHFPVILRQWLGETDVKLEVREVLLDISEMRYIEEFLLRTTTIPVRHFSVSFLRMEQVEDLSTKRRHTCTPTDIDHLSFSWVDVEFTIRS